MPKGEWHFYTIEADQDDVLQVDLQPLNFDIDLYVKSGSDPSVLDYDCRSTNVLTLPEQCTVPTPADGTVWHIGVYAPGTLTNSGGAYELTMQLTKAAHQLSVQLAGSGSGRVHSQNLPSIDCGTDCESQYRKSDNVELVATPQPGSVFQGWTGGCFRVTNGNRCTVSMSSDKIITFTFVPHVVINEIMMKPLSRPYALPEWFELHNPSGVDIDIDGLRIADSATIGCVDKGIYASLQSHSPLRDLSF